MIPIAKPFIGDEEKSAVISVLESGMLAQGPRVKEFEERFSGWLGVEHGAAVSSGTAALHLALNAMGVGPGDEVITTPLTFFASASTIMMNGAKPVFADVDRETLNVDPDSARGLVTERTKAVVPVHLYGLSADMGPLLDLAEEKGLLVLEDSAQSHGALYKGRKVGGIGHAGCFSFYPTKNMMSGEGGMVTTNNEELDQRIRLLRNHGMPARYTHTVLGYNLRMTDICAAIGLCQLERIDGFNERRRENARQLTKGIEALPGLRPPVVPDGLRHVFHQYAVIVEDDFPMDRDRLQQFCRDNGVGADVGYHIPLYNQEIFKTYEYGGGRCPNAEYIAGRQLLIPVHHAVSDEDVQTILGVLERASKD